MRKVRQVLGCALLAAMLMKGFGGLALVQAAPPAQASTPVYLTEQVNVLRAEYGLPAYQLNSALMSAAQSHAQWMANTGQISHTGAGGTTPTDRAIAAGYGSRENARASENIYGGGMATADVALGWWRNSPIHFQGMTSTNYSEIGAGAAISENGAYFVLVFGVRSERPAPSAPAPQAQDQGDAAGPAAQPLPTFEVVPVQLAEAAEDGSLTHVVAPGQTVWDIATAYDQPISEILALNRLGEDDIISPGDALIIVPAPIEIAVNPDGSITHAVQPGQSLWAIADTYDVPLERLLLLNNLTEAAVIYPEQVLLVQPPSDASLSDFIPTPQPVSHTVQPGQSLWNIAALHRVPLEQILSLNNLTEASVIQPGDTLLISAPPTATPAPTSPAEAAAPATHQPTPQPLPTDPANQPPEVDQPEAARRGPLPRAVWWSGLAAIALAGAGLIAYGALATSRQVVE